MKKLLFGILTFLGIGLSFCSADGIYWNKTGGLISIIYNDGSNTLTLQDKNIGATCTDIESSCSYGKYFQWGNNFGFLSGNYTIDSSITPDLSSYGPSNYYNSNGVWYTNYGSDNSQNMNMWGGVDGTLESMQGPCPSGYHVIDSRGNLSSVFSNLGISFNRVGVSNYLKFPMGGYIPGSYGILQDLGHEGGYWASTSTMNFQGNRIVLYYLYDDLITSPGPIGHGYNIRCFKNESVSPDYTRYKLYGDVIARPALISILYNDGNSSVDVACNGDNVIQIEGLSTMTNNNVFTPYYNISYIDEDNQSLVESYSKDILYLENGQFKKTYTGDNDRILTYQGNDSENIFTGYVPVFDFTGDTIVNTGNVFNNFSDNALKVLLSNIPSYIQYITIFTILVFLFSFIRRFKRKS